MFSFGFVNRCFPRLPLARASAMAVGSKTRKRFSLPPVMRRNASSFAKILAPRGLHLVVAAWTLLGRGVRASHDGRVSCSQMFSFGFVNRCFPRLCLARLTFKVFCLFARLPAQAESVRSRHNSAQSRCHSAANLRDNARRK